MNARTAAQDYPWPNNDIIAAIRQHRVMLAEVDRLRSLLSPNPTRPECGACHKPLGTAGCSHIWLHDGEVVMSEAEWHDLLRTSDWLRRLAQEHPLYEGGAAVTALRAVPSPTERSE